MTNAWVRPNRSQIPPQRRQVHKFQQPRRHSLGDTIFQIHRQRGAVFSAGQSQDVSSIVAFFVIYISFLLTAFCPQIIKTFKQPSNIPAFDHFAPKPFGKTLAPNVIRQHGLDLGKISGFFWSASGFFHAQFRARVQKITF